MLVPVAARDPERPRAHDLAPRQRPCDRRALVRQQGGIDGERLDEPQLQHVVASHHDALDRGRAPLAVLGASPQGREGGRHVALLQRDARLDRRLHLVRAERAAVGERDSAAKRQQEGAPPLEDLPLLAQRGGEVAPPVGGEQRLEHVRHDLELLGDLERRRREGADGVGEADDESPAARNLLGRGFAGLGREPRRLFQVGVGLRVLATEVGERRGERQQPGQHLGRARVPGQRDALLGPAARLLAAPGLPGGLGREQQRARRPGRLGRAPRRAVPRPRLPGAPHRRAP